MKRHLVRSYVRTGVLGVTVGLGALLGAPGQSRASDHIDSPTLAHDHGSDLGDLYGFLDPNDNSQVVLIMTTNPFIISSEIIGQAIFDSNIRYRFEIENTGDAVPDMFLDVHYTKGIGRLQPQTATITLPNGKSFSAPTTPSDETDNPPAPVITTDPASGAKFFGGATDDPFFLDNTAANRFVLSSFANPGNPDRSVFQRGRDTYAGFNILVTAVRVPASMLKGKKSDVIGINAVTQRRRIQRQANGDVKGLGQWITVDRDGTPLVNNGLVPGPRKNEYNNASTGDDASGRFKADIVKDLKNLGTDDAHIAMLAAAAVDKGDILRLNLAIPNSGSGGGDNAAAKFPDGRRLKDDVVDAIFTIINNGVLLSDNVAGNEDTFRNEFPFVSKPVTPNPKGVTNPDDRTRL